MASKSDNLDKPTIEIKGPPSQMATALPIHLYCQNSIPNQAHPSYPPFCGYGSRTPVVTTYHHCVLTVLT